MAVKECIYCNTPYEQERNEVTCQNHRKWEAYVHLSGESLENLKRGIEQFPKVPIFNKESWQQSEVQVERVYYLYPLIKKGSITLVAAQAGVGKTLFCMALTDALAKGENFGIWENQAGGPLKCLYFDGEMSTDDLNERIIEQLDVNEKFMWYSKAANEMSDNHFPGNLADPEHRLAISAAIAKYEIDFVVLDNLASLAPRLNENIKASYDPINQWLLSLRYSGVTVILVHHMNKSGGQRGTSGRLDNVDNSLYLNSRKGELSADVTFELNFAKFRGKVTKENQHLVKNRKISYEQDENGNWIWDFGGSTSEQDKQILSLLGTTTLSQKDIAAKVVGANQTAVSRAKRDFMALGYLYEEQELDEDGKQKGRPKAVLTTEGQAFLGEKYDSDHIEADQSEAVQLDDI